MFDARSKVSQIVETQTFCAWCIEEKGEQPKEGDSHGICDRHEEVILEAHRQRKAEKGKRHD